PTPVPGVSLSRPLLDWHVAQRVQALPNVEVIYGQKVTGLLATRAGTPSCRVRGVTSCAAEGEGVVDQEADFVVDASGRGSQAPAWLKALGLAAAEQRDVTMNVGYASRLYRRTAFPQRGKVLLVTPKPPTATRMGALFPVEQDRWVCSLVGCQGDFAPTEE